MIRLRSLKRNLGFIFIGVLLLETTAFGAIIRVKPDGNDANSGGSWPLAKKTVSAAIAAANQNDEIWVAAGTYQEKIQNKVVKVGGVDTAVDVALYGGFAGNESTREERDWKANMSILDGASSGVVVNIIGGASLATRIDGFHIANGLGGISMLGSAPTIANNTIRGNSGSGISCNDYKIIGVIPPNVVFPVITNNTIVDNSSDSGAGIAVWGSDTIAMWHLPPSQPTITHNIIARNVASDNGGGIGCWGHTAPLIANNFILANSASSDEYFFRGGGGGIYATSNDTDNVPVEYAISAPVIINNVIAANGAGLGGGICTIDTDIGEPIITNNTVVANNGSGIWWSTSYGNHAPKIQNNLVAFNTWGLEQVGTEYPATIKFNCVYGNTLQGKKTDYKGIADQTGINGNISVDPKLANYQIGEFHLQPGSPCIDAGTLDAVGAGWTDIDGQARVIGNGVDIGADESDGTLWSVPVPVIHVRTSGDDAHDGLSWATAKKTVIGGIAAAALTGGEVWVAAGTYTEHISIPAFVYLYGGFAGDETNRDARDVSGNPTILDGGGIHGVVAIRNAGYLVSALDGFTIQNGGTYTNGDWTKMYGPGGLGGGIYISVAGPYITNNTIKRNSLAYSNVYPNPPSHGGGIYCYLNYGEISGNTITENEIRNTNPFDGSGGGIYCIHSMPVIDGNTITQNHARSGSAIYGTDCGASITYNTIHNNAMYNTYPLPAYLGSVTGAIDLSLCQDFLIEGNLINGNTGGEGGGINVSSNFAGRIQNNMIINNAASDPTAGNGGIGGRIYALAPLEAIESLFIVNNTIVGNTATAWGTLEQGGGISVSIPPPIFTPPTPIPNRIVIANNIIAFNSSGIYETLTYPQIPPTLINNDLFNTGANYLSPLPPGATDISVNPDFVNRPGGDFHLKSTSLCIDAGDNGAVPTGLVTDFEGNNRIYDGKNQGVAKVDIGADEYMPSDSTPPETIITDGPSGTITVRDVTFTFSGSDNLSPVSHLLYATYLEGYEAIWSDFSSSTTKSYTHLPDGTYTVHVMAKDEAGNEDPSPATRTFTVNYIPPDTTPPKGSVVVNGGSTYTNTNVVTLTLSALDASGVAEMCISNTPSCSTWESYKVSRSWELPPGDGDKAVYVWFKDSVGNATTTPYSGSIVLDTTAPAAPFGLSSIPGGWTNVNAFGATWTNPSDPSTIAAAWYKIGSPPVSSTDGNRVAGDDTKSLSGLTVTAEGETSLYVWLEDGAENKDHTHRAQVTLRYDATPPTSGTISINGGVSSTHSLIVTLNGLGAADLSGIAQMRFSNNAGGPWSSPESYATTKTNWDLSKYGGDSSVGLKTVYAQYQDAAGNWSGSFSDQIDYRLVDPAEGTLGTELTVWGANLGIKKGKVLVNGVAQKIVNWTSSSVDCLLSKAILAGTYDVTIVPAGGSSSILKDGFTVKGPEIEAIPAGKPLNEITIKGNFFGTKKGKILLEYTSKGTTKTKSCKVTSWSMDAHIGKGEITFVVPKMITGKYPLKITNSVGETIAELNIE